MLGSFQRDETRSVAKSRVWLCLLLPLLLLYDPFLTTAGPSSSVSVSHHASYRATVASSELLKFRNSDGHELIAVADLGLLEALTLLKPHLHPSARYENPEDPSPPDRFISGNLWVRPPPVA
jgi:hypothetical protein